MQGEDGFEPSVVSLRSLLDSAPKCLWVSIAVVSLPLALIALYAVHVALRVQLQAIQINFRQGQNGVGIYLSAELLRHCDLISNLVSSFSC